MLSWRPGRWGGCRCVATNGELFPRGPGVGVLALGNPNALVTTRKGVAFCKAVSPRGNAFVRREGKC